MITKAELTEAVNELNEKCQYIASELESLWQTANAAGLDDFARRIERIQFSDYANPSQLESKLRFKELFQIIEENEKVKHLDKFLEYERIVNQVIGLGKDAEEAKSVE
mgnify:CR=1 FL=1